MLIMEPQMLCRLKHDLLASNISLHYQPVYSAATQKIVGFEALLR
ncbi:TPA: EAL domain-containing protein [Kluyvera intermedia]|nr:EAL domain-containing protein [Kluyvera intermedia]